MNIPKSEKKKEALSRMKKLGYQPEAIEAFDKGDTLMCTVPFHNDLAELNADLKAQIKSLEEQYNMLVYMVINNYTCGFNMTSLVFVSDYEEEWEMDNADIAEGYALTYTINHDVEIFSEFGSIGIEMANGIPHRV